MRTIADRGPVRTGEDKGPVRIRVRGQGTREDDISYLVPTGSVSLCGGLVG